MIEDLELRNLFETSSEEHLQKLEAGLLHLEKHPQDKNRLQEALREAHTLKGDARMLGVKDVETLAHQIEHLLGQLKEDDTALQGGVSDRLYRGLDALRQLVQEAVTGEPSGVNTFQMLAFLMGAPSEELTPPAPPETPPPPLEVPVAPPPPTVVDTLPTSTPLTAPPHQPPAIQPPQPLPVDRVPASNPNYRIETIRVETRHLDALMTHTGELMVTKMRLNTHLAEIETLANLCEEWSRQLHANTLAFNPITLRTRDLGDRPFNDSFNTENLEHLTSLIHQLRTRATENIARLDVISNELDSGVRTLRLLPLSTIFNLFHRLVRDLSQQQGKPVNFIVEGGETKADKRILEEMKDPLMHMLRNSIDHGIETPEERAKLNKPAIATLCLRGYQTGNSIVIEVSDDGQGLIPDQIKQVALDRGHWRAEELDAMTPQQIQSLIFSPGFSTRKFVTEVSGRGVGLDVVRTNVERLKGSIQVESTPGTGSCFRIHLNTSLATIPVLILKVGEFPYALPVEFVQTNLLVAPEEIFTLEGRETLILDEQPVSAIPLAELLELPVEKSQETKAKALSCIILQVGSDRLGLLVDELLDEQDVILKPQSQLLKRVRNVTGATILGTGEVCMVLNAQDLMKSVQKRRMRSLITPTVIKPETPPKPDTKTAVILLAEDSIATRTQEKRILESAGYEVVTAVDGLDAYNKLRTRTFDAVVSDVQMPNLDGLALAARIRQHQEFNELPIILVTSLASDEDKRRGAEAGANAYITKGGFSQEVLLETLRRLV